MNAQDLLLTEKGPMTVLEAIEIPRVSISRSRRYAVLILLILIVLLAYTTIIDFGTSASQRAPVDFDDFYIAGYLVWRGEILKAYHFKTLFDIQKYFYHGKEAFIPWTYPPQFDLLVAPLALLPLGLAYALFTFGTLAAFLLTLRRIADEYFHINPYYRLSRNHGLH